MTTKKKLLKNIREAAEADLPTKASDATNETPESLAKKGARAVKAEQDAEKAAVASKPGNEKTVATEETEDEMKAEAADADKLAESDDADADDVKEQDEDELHEEDEEKLAEEEDEIKEEDEEKQAVAEEDDAEVSEEDEVKLSEEDEEKLAEEDEDDVKEAADALTKDENLPESFKTKVASIFEAAVKRTSKRRAEAYKAKLVEAYNKKLATKKKTISEALVNKVDGYLDYVVEEWMKENEVAIETSLRSNVTEKFIVGLKNLFENHYIEVPAEKTDVITQQEQTIAKLEKELNEELVKSVELRKENINLKRANIIKKHTEGLTVSDAAKFSELCEGVSFETAKAFSQKLQVIKETYFAKGPRNSGDLDASLLTEGGLTHIEPTPAQTEVDIYAQAISRMVKR